MFLMRQNYFWNLQLSIAKTQYRGIHGESMGSAVGWDLFN